VTEPAGRPRRWWKYLLIAAGLVLIAVLAALWYSTTNSFQAYVRGRMIREVERITGGRAEIGSFHVVPFHLQVEVRDITVHGKEGPKEIPLAHADSLVAHMKVISFLRTEFGFTALALDNPVIHIAIGADGATTNVPSLRVVPESVPLNARVQQLFALSIDHLSVHNGTLLWGDRKIPLDFSVQGTNLQMDYAFLRNRYEGHLSLGKVDTAFEDYRPFAWMTTVDFTLAPTFCDVQSLNWHSGKSTVQMSGRIADFGNPQLDGSYTAQINLEEAAAVARRHDLRGGLADFKGNGHWSLDEFTTAGAVMVRDLAWQEEQFSLKRTGVAADYQVTDQQIKVSKLRGNLLGGNFTGDVQIDNWLHSIPLPSSTKAKKEDLPVIAAARPPLKKGEKAKATGVQSGAVHLRLQNVSVAETAAALDVPAHRLGRFRPVGSADGTVDALWKGSPQNAEIAFGFEVSPPARAAARELPLTAQFQGKYRGASDSLELTKFNLNTPAYSD
jgi:translocation and assembly module TamB